MAKQYDVAILGAGAAGMMAAMAAGKRGRSVVILDHAKAPGEKIRISGGGRCNFTNIHAGPKNYLSNNPQAKAGERCEQGFHRHGRSPQDCLA